MFIPHAWGCVQTDATTPNNVGSCCVWEMLEELWKRIQHCCATLRRSRNKRNVGSRWLKSLTGFKLCATTSNNMQQGVQTDATCNIQQCWELLANNVLSVCTRFDAQRQSSTSSTVEYQSLISFSRILSRLHLLRRLWHMLNNAFHCTKYF